MKIRSTHFACLLSLFLVTFADSLHAQSVPDCTSTNDTDMDGVNDCKDNCPATYNAKQKDADGDGIGNDCDLPVICPASISCVPPDGLQYGSTVTLACSLSPNNYDLLRVFVGNTKLENVTSSLSTTLDKAGTYEVRVDYAYLMSNTTGTFYGSWCPAGISTTVVVQGSDEDSDSDGVPDASDICPTTANSDQANADADQHGDACDPCTDTDGDGFGDPGLAANTCNPDNCPSAVNFNQADQDGDGIGNTCDPTNDNDEQNNDCYGSPTDTPDEDADGIGDCIDNCPGTYNAKQRDADKDGIGNDCDLPIICPATISCTPPPDLELGSTVPLVCSFQPGNYDLLVVFVGNKKISNVTSSLSTTLNKAGTYKVRVDYAWLRTDTSGTFNGSLCPAGISTTVVVQESDKDSDSDGIPDTSDNCPSTANANQEDLDNDGIGDACDPPACGNGFQEMGEACDATDGCPADCTDHCLDDPAKLEEGQCGCGVAETDTDSDGVANCKDSEECDGLDNNGNGSIDDGFDVGTLCSAGVGACEKQGQKVCTADKNGTECNAIAGITTIEICDGLDNDCDSATDEDLNAATTCGVGACASTGVITCSGGKLQASTCQPKTGSAEICDGVDNNCDSTVDENLEQPTSCGVGACASTGSIVCTDGKLQANTCQPKTGSAEVCDGLDNDCDGTVDDGLEQATSCSVGACAASGSIVCSGGTLQADTCQPKTGSEEVCDGLDNNCDGTVDENLDQPTTCGIGECAAVGVIACSGGQLQANTCQPKSAIVESCDNVDNNCDGATDEDLTQECYSGDPVTKGVGICVVGSHSCQAGVWSACSGEVLPSNNESCDNAFDDNCNGETNEDCKEDVCQPVLVKTYEEPVSGENDGNAEKIIAEGSNENSYKLKIVGAVRLSHLINVGKEYILFVDDKNNAYSAPTKDVANEEVEARRLFTINGFIDWAADSKTGVRILTTGGLRDIPDITAESFPPQEEWQKVLDTQELGTYSRLAVTEQGQNEIVTWLQGTNRISRLNVQEEKLVIEPVIHCSEQSALSIRSFISRNNQFYLYNNDGTIYRTSSSCEELSEIFKPASEQVQATPTDLPTDVLALDPQSQDIYFYNTSAASPGISRLHFAKKTDETTPLPEVQLHSNGQPHSFAVITQCTPVLKIVIADESKPEVCDGKDNDLDGKIDEDCECNAGETQTCGTDEGECEQGEQVCLDIGKWSDECAGSVGPAPEECDGKDNNCDGQIDEISDDGCKAEESPPAASGETSSPAREGDTDEADDAPDEILDETDEEDAPVVDDSGEGGDADGIHNTNRTEGGQGAGCSLNPSARVDTSLIFLLLIAFLHPYCLRAIFLRSK